MTTATRTVQVETTTPWRYAETTLDGFEPVTPSAAKALQAARRLVDLEISSLVLAGPTGVGKTHLAAGIVHGLEHAAVEHHNRRMDRYEADLAVYEVEHQAWLAAWDREMAAGRYGSPDVPTQPRQPLRPQWRKTDLPAWLNVADAIVRMRLEMGMELEDRTVTREVAALHGHGGLVVLDDLGREKASDWTGELVYALVNARYENELATLVTTNLTGAELAASPYWPAISRLAEDGELVRIDAPDRRLAKPKE